MDRLSTLDAEFLHLEDAISPMHIAGLCTFEGPAPSAKEMTRLLEGKLSLIPRYRKRVRFPPGELGRPVWVDDPHFDLAYHVRRTAIPAPGDATALSTLMGRVMSQLLDRNRPLWEVWIVEGLENGDWGLISKVHHAMVDGLSGIDLTTTIFDAARDQPLPPIVPWTAAPEPSRRAIVFDAWRGLAEDAARIARRVIGGAAHPRDAARAVVETAAGLTTFTRRLLTAKKGTIQGTIGGHRGYAFARASLADVQVIRKALGGTINDVVLAAATGGYRTLIAHQGGDPDTTRVRSLVPVSVRAPGQRGSLGNRVSALLLDLPVQLADPAERLRCVHAEMERLKASHMADAGAVVVELGDLAPPMLVGAITRFVARVSHRVPQRFIATVTTNVPGPREPLYCLGRKMLDWYPYVPIYQGVRVGTAILSYAGRLAFGVTTDADSLKGASVLANGIADGIAELLAIARPAEAPRPAAH